MKIIGIDPGLSGAIVILENNKPDKPQHQNEQNLVKLFKHYN